MKKKVAIISSHTRSLFWFRMDMMQAFIKKGYDVIALGQEDESEWKESFFERNIEYRQIYVERNGLNPFGDLKTYKQLKSFLKAEKPDKIFCYQAKTNIYTCLAAKKCKIKEVYPLIAGLGSVFRGEGLKNKFVKFILSTEYRIALRNAKSVMFQNNDDLGVFVDNKIVSKEKCKIINGSGVDTTKFNVLPFPEKTAFLMISRLIKDKGVMEYLEACRLLKKTDDARCLLVGPFDTNPSALTQEELQAYVDDGSIEYFGEQIDVIPYIAQSSVFVLPSYHEGTPKTVLENMSCGRAVITTDAPGCRETVIDGKNGFLVPTHNVEQVVEKMKRFIYNTELVQKMGIEGRNIAVEKYDVQKVNDSIIAIMAL